MANPGYLPAPLSGETVRVLGAAAPTTWVRRLATVVNNILAGRLNVVLPVTLSANATSTTVIDARISVFCALLFSPITADAAAIMGSLYVSSQQSGQATLTHALTAGEADCTFNMVIIG